MSILNSIALKCNFYKSFNYSTDWMRNNCYGVQNVFIVVFLISFILFEVNAAQFCSLSALRVRYLSA